MQEPGIKNFRFFFLFSHHRSCCLSNIKPYDLQYHGKFSHFIPYCVCGFHHGVLNSKRVPFWDKTLLCCLIHRLKNQHSLKILRMKKIIKEDGVIAQSYIIKFCIFFLFLRPMCKSYVYLTRKILIGGGYHMECRKMVTTI